MISRLWLTIPLIVASVVGTVMVTVEGWDTLIQHFSGSSLGFWKTYGLAVAFGILRNNPLVVTKNLKSDVEILAIGIAALLIDCIAVYGILPWALS